MVTWKHTTNVEPLSDSSVNLGSTTRKWNQIHGVCGKFSGDVCGNTVSASGDITTSSCVCGAGPYQTCNGCTGISGCFNTCAGCTINVCNGLVITI